MAQQCPCVDYAHYHVSSELKVVCLETLAMQAQRPTLRATQRYVGFVGYLHSTKSCMAKPFLLRLRNTLERIRKFSQVFPCNDVVEAHAMATNFL